MADPTTANTSMAVPVRGSDVGTWDIPVNGNFNSLDAMMGGVTSLALSSIPITLATSQALVNVIRFTGTLTANVSVTLPGIYKSWTIDNQIVNSPSSFAVTLVSTSAASVIGCPPGSQDVFYDGSTVNYRNLGRVGEYWDYAAATVPTWVTASTKPPYLNCNATTFSSATYPILANLLGTTTLPDSRGKSRFALDQGAGLISTAATGFSGTTVGSTAGAQATTLGTSNLPPYTPAGAATGVYTGNIMIPGTAVLFGGGSISFIYQSPTLITQTTAFAGTPQGGTSVPLTNLPPAYIFGITMIRAA